MNGRNWKKGTPIHGMFKSVPHNFAKIASIGTIIATEQVSEPRGKSQKCIKSQGTSKAVHHCSAYIKATHNVTTSKVIVKYNATHYIHVKQLGHLRIDSQTRNTIASKLQQGIGT